MSGVTCMLLFLAPKATAPPWGWRNQKGNITPAISGSLERATAVQPTPAVNTKEQRRWRPKFFWPLWNGAHFFSPHFPHFPPFVVNGKNTP